MAYRDGAPPTRILEWDSRGRLPARAEGGRFVYIREIGQGFAEFHSIRIDEHDDVWAVSESAKEIVKFSAEGEVLLRFGGKQEADAPELDAPEIQLQRPYLDNPSDLAWDANGNVFVADNGQQPRIVKFNRRGQFLGAISGRGSRPGHLNAPHSIATDASGNVYVADGGNSRIEVFSNSLGLVGVYYGMGTPWAICITKGRHQYLYSASNPEATDGRRENTIGEVYKLELDGTILGKAAGDETSSRTFTTMHHIDCRQANEIAGVGLVDGLPQVITFKEK